MGKNNSNKNKSTKVTVELCMICNEKVVDDPDELSFQCDICDKWTHAFCTRLDRKRIQVLANDTETQFHCIRCISNDTRTIDHNSVTIQNNSTTSQFAYITAKLDELATIKEDVTSMKDTIEFISNQYSDLQLKFKKLNTEFNSIRNEHLNLKKTVAQQTQRIKSLENAKLKSQCFFKHSTNKINKLNPADSVITALDAIGVKVQTVEIKSAVIQPKLSNDEKTVVKIEFRDDSKKFEVMKNKSKFKMSRDFSDVSIFDVLSRDASELYRAAKELRKVGYMFIYHRNGRIFAKKIENSVPVHLTNEDMISKMIGAASTIGNAHMDRISGIGGARARSSMIGQTQSNIGS